ncbi:hypothetical protein N7540_005629 [Penicillium herquei]|nr:hypothetical protein N7540_005629 [Penicillium herquei]
MTHVQADPTPGLTAGPASILPRIQKGVPDANLLPGFWSTRILRFRYRLAKKRDRFKYDALYEIWDRPAKREIQIRSDRNWAPENLEDMLSSDHFMMEGAVCYIVGEVRLGELACANCQAGDGPFPFCVVVDRSPHFKDCANCHFAKRTKKVHCQLYDSSSSSSDND